MSGNNAAENMVREVFLNRSIKAPREDVFRAWTDPKQVAQWWGPHGFTNPVVEIDARKGGAIRLVMRGPDGAEYPTRGEFRDVMEPDWLVFTTVLEGGGGTVMIEALNTVIFSERNGKTEVALRARVLNSIPAAAPMLAGMRDGWAQSLERLEEAVTKAGAAL